MTVSTTTTTTGTAATNTTSTASATSSTNTATNQFLGILLTELQNQNPLNPTDTATFTTQLAQYSSLEQQIDTNTKLDTLISNSSATSVSPVAYLGTTVNYSSNTAPVQNDQASWTYSSSGASTVNISVADASGNVVYTGTGDTTSGNHTLTLTAGSNVTDGTPLTITVTATDSTGATVKPTVTAQATVDAVDTTSGATTLEAAGYSFAETLVTRVAKPATSTTATTSTPTNS